MASTTKNLGLVKAIHVGNNPPINTQMLWYNTNPMVNQHYYYDVITTSWVSLTSGSIAAINVSYDNTTSLLAATDVQAAIDELDAILDSLSFTAANISYDNSGSGLIAINVQNAIDEVLGLIPTVSYPVTNGSNGVYLSGTNIKLGTNPLTENTTITTAAFYLDLFGNLRLRPTNHSATSQNKTLQLANTTGAVSLVNKGMYVRINYSFPTLKQVYILLADGLTPSASNIGVGITALAPIPTRDWTIYSKVNNSGIDDGFSYVGGVSLTNLIGSKILVTLSMNVRSNIDIIGMVLGAPGDGNVWTNEYGIGVGLPKRVAGLGYAEGIFCPADQVTRLHSQFILDTTSGNGALGNWGDLMLYRNTGIAATDALASIVTILGASMTFQQLEK